MLNPFMPSGFFYFNSLDRFISYIRGVWLVLIIVMFCRNILTLCDLWRLIWVYIVCQCPSNQDTVSSGSTLFASVPFWGALGLYGLIKLFLFFAGLGGSDGCASDW